MASKLGIINGALHEVGTGRLTTLDDNNTQSRAALDIYDQVRDYLLEKFDWMFAKKRAQLSRLVATPEFEYDYYYSLPSDFIRILGLYNSSSNYEIEGNNVLAIDDEEVYVKYIAKVTNEGYWPPSFARVFSLEMGMRLCEPLSKDSALKGDIEKLKKEAIASAYRLGAIQDEPKNTINDATGWQSAGR